VEKCDFFVVKLGEKARGLGWRERFLRGRRAGWRWRTHRKHERRLGMTRAQCETMFGVVVGDFYTVECPSEQPFTVSTPLASIPSPRRHPQRRWHPFPRPQREFQRREKKLSGASDGGAPLGYGRVCQRGTADHTCFYSLLQSSCVLRT